MTKETLSMIISENWEAAKRGDAFAISAVIGAQAAMKKLKNKPLTSYKWRQNKMIALILFCTIVAINLGGLLCLVVEMTE